MLFKQLYQTTVFPWASKPEWHLKWPLKVLKNIKSFPAKSRDIYLFRVLLRCRFHYPFVILKIKNPKF